MRGVSVTQELVRANTRYAATFPGPRPRQPRLHLTVITCMDSRLDLFGALGLEVGDAHLLRNAGGIPTDDVLRSLAISQRAMGTSEVVLVHHTECGMAGFDDDAFRAELEAESGQAPTWRVPGFDDVYADLREAVETVRNCPWLPNRDNVSGFLFDVATGVLHEVS